MSGLALLTGGTAVAAVAGGQRSIFATVLLGVLTLGMSHSLAVEIRRQAHRRSARWCRHDTVNTVLLASWAAGAVPIALTSAPVPVRAVGLVLAAGYAAGCAYFVVERRRTVAASPPPPVPTPAGDLPVAAPEVSESTTSW